MVSDFDTFAGWVQTGVAKQEVPVDTAEVHRSRNEDL